DLAAADPETIRAELAISKRKLADAVGKPVLVFAYPFGGPNHISEAARALVREAGFICCASCYGGINSRHPEPFNLKRIGIAEWYASPDQFGVELVRAQGFRLGRLRRKVVPIDQV